MSNNNDPIERAERFQRVFVLPVVEALRAEMASHLAPLVKAQAETDAQVKAQGEDIQRMKDNEKKALLGWGVYATVASVALATAWERIRAHFH